MFRIFLLKERQTNKQTNTGIWPFMAADKSQQIKKGTQLSIQTHHNKLKDKLNFCSSKENILRTNGPHSFGGLKSSGSDKV